MSKNVSLVLSSGGARGVAHIGVIKALEDNGYNITSVAGSSMGAVIGAVYAAGKLDEFTEWICNLDKFDVFKLVDFTLSTQGFIRGERVFNEMKKFIGEINIEDLSIPVAIVATDIANKKEKVFTKGNVYTALRASASIPSVLKPVDVEGIDYVDGGVLNPLPYQYVERSENDLLVMSDVNANVKCRLKAPNKQEQSQMASFIEKWNDFFPKAEKAKNDKPSTMSYFDLIARSVDLMQDRITDYIIEQANADFLVQISRETCNVFSFYRSKEVMDYGYEEFMRQAKGKLIEKK